MIVIVSDFFSSQFLGGAELTTESLLEVGFDNFKKINSHNLRIDDIINLKDKKWIFFNYSNLPDSIILEIVKNSIQYSIVEYDYKYCSYRLKTKHEAMNGYCDCEKSTRGKIVSIFMAKANNIFFMSQKQKNVYEEVFPFLKKHLSSHVINSSFSEKEISYIDSLETKNKNNKYLILKSDSWVKGTEECIKYAKKNGLEYEIVSNLKHENLLKKMSSSKGLIFLPNGFDTCPRITIEAKMLDCILILNDNVQHKDESWFLNKESILEHNNKQKHFFYEKCLKQEIKFLEKEDLIKFHFIIPGFNVQEWLPKCLKSIKKQEYKNYSVTYIDDISTDKTIEMFLKETKEDERYKIIINKDKNYALKNISIAIEELDAKNDDVIIILDGDDWLSSPNVLQYLNSFYQENKCLMTYGSYMYYPHGDIGVEPSEYSKQIIKDNEYRNDTWRASHLRTFKKELWNRINKEDFMDEYGKYYESAYDQAMMLPMLEMCGEKAKYVSEILHVYNRANLLNVDKIKKEQQHQTMIKIRKKKKYKRINFEN